MEAAGLHGGDHGGLVGVAAAGSEALDRADGDALVGDDMVLAPGGQDRQPSPEEMRRVGARVAAHFLEHDLVEPAARVLHLGEPLAEAEEAHAAALPAIIAVDDGAGGDVAVAAAQCPAGGGAQIEGEHRGQRSQHGQGQRRNGRNTCAWRGRDQSRGSHGDLLRGGTAWSGRRRRGSWRSSPSSSAWAVGAVQGDRWPTCRRPFWGVDHDFRRRPGNARKSAKYSLR